MKRFAKRSKRGQTLVEYSLILSFISVVAISVLYAMGTNVKGIFTTVSSQMSLASTGGTSSSDGSDGSGGSGSSGGSGGGSPTHPGGH